MRQTHTKYVAFLESVYQFEKCRKAVVYNLSGYTISFFSVFKYALIETGSILALVYDKTKIICHFLIGLY